MKGKYTQEELLLLSNFVYVPACISDEPIEAIIDAYREEDGSFTAASVIEAARGGGMSCEDVATVFTRMDRRISENPDFGKISASRILEEKDVRALCYTDPKDADPVVVFRGTGGTKEAWCDNFEGAFTDETKIQQIADDFVESECGIYNDIVVTGHSKGGNLAQFVTVSRNERIRECLSFDGQGFGEELLIKDPAGIVDASQKITSVCAYNDFVNILLTSIAGTCLFVFNDSSPAAAHSPVTLLTENEFDVDGNFLTIRTQGLLAKGLGYLTDGMCGILRSADDDDRRNFATVAGTAISLALTTPPDKLAEDCIAPTLGLVSAGFAQKMALMERTVADSRPPAAGSVSIDTDACAGAAGSIEEGSELIAAVQASVEGVRKNMAFTITSKLCAEKALENICEDLSGIKRGMYEMSKKIRRVNAAYKKCEEEAAALMGF